MQIRDSYLRMVFLLVLLGLAVGAARRFICGLVDGNSPMEIPYMFPTGVRKEMGGICAMYLKPYWMAICSTVFLREMLRSAEFSLNMCIILHPARFIQ